MVPEEKSFDIKQVFRYCVLLGLTIGSSRTHVLLTLTTQ